MTRPMKRRFLVPFERQVALPWLRPAKVPRRAVAEPRPMPMRSASMASGSIWREEPGRSALQPRFYALRVSNGCRTGFDTMVHAMGEVPV